MIKLGLKRFSIVTKKAVPGSGYPLLLYMIWRLNPQHVVPANLNDSSAEKNLASSDSSASPMEFYSGTSNDFWSFISNQNENAPPVVAQSGELGKEYSVLNFDVIENSVPSLDDTPESHGFALPPFLEELPVLSNFPFYYFNINSVTKTQVNDTWFYYNLVIIKLIQFKRVFSPLLFFSNIQRLNSCSGSGVG